MVVGSDNELGEVSQTGVLLRTVTRLFAELQQRSFACCDVRSATHCVILTTLEREGHQTLTALTRTLQLDRAWLSRTTDDLVEQGLLVKTPHPGDRRALLLRLTDAGYTAARNLDAALNAQSARVLARLTEKDRNATLQLLSNLSGALQAELHGALQAELHREGGCGC